MKQYAISMDEDVMGEFDEMIGDVTRSAYMRRLVINEITRLKSNPNPLQSQPQNTHV